MGSWKQLAHEVRFVSSETALEDDFSAIISDFIDPVLQQRSTAISTPSWYGLLICRSPEPALRLVSPRAAEHSTRCDKAWSSESALHDSLRNTLIASANCLLRPFVEEDRVLDIVTAPELRHDYPKAEYKTRDGDYNFYVVTGQ